MRLHVKRKISKITRLVFHRRCLLLVLFVSTFSMISVFYLVQWNIICFNIDIENRLNTLCMEYNEGKAFGRLCEPLCNNGEISALSCEPMHKGKFAVFTALWNNSLIVIKSHRVKSEYIPLQWIASNSSEVFPNYEELVEMVTQSILANFGMQKENLMNRLYPFLVDYHNDVSRELMINLWQLSQDNEYVTLMINQHSHLFPKILSSCGTYYAVEYAKPISRLNIYSDRLEDFVSRVRQAKLMLELLDELQTSFVDPIHICDVKLEHFGLLNGRQVLLDADTVFPKAVVDRSVADGRECWKHSDCDLFDCRSLCNKVLNICDTPTVNNNLQTVCQKIFLDSGLLISRHLPLATSRLLRDCANPNFSQGRQIAPVQFHYQIANFVNEFLNMVALPQNPDE
ncbi:hypothetical protein GHT06_022778 [Daphnia sinensis]|uniref:FAM69 N-terminal domain-containing protein n=1 Tax=Daphnia sinensis TaxID=1820382 RepID=A0AAD5KIU4_9CRUS|nr:hypothetical protein GHT06_022778 [Daphnia sinensis]